MDLLTLAVYGNQTFQILIQFQRSVVHSATSEYMNQSQAEHFCRTYMEKSAGFEACSKVPSIQPQNAIDNCILDIQVSSIFTTFIKLRL